MYIVLYCTLFEYQSNAFKLKIKMTSLAHTQSNIQLGNQVKVWFRATTNFITVC